MRPRTLAMLVCSSTIVLSIKKSLFDFDTASLYKRFIVLYSTTQQARTVELQPYTPPRMHVHQQQPGMQPRNHCRSNSRSSGNQKQNYA